MTLPLYKKNKSSSANQKQELLITTQKRILVPTRNVFEKGSLTSDQVGKIKIWRSKYFVSNSNKEPRSSYSVAAAITGALLENPHKWNPVGPGDGPEKIDVAKGPSADSEWGDNLILL